MRAIAEDTVERIDFMQLSPQRALVIGETTSLLSTGLEAKGSKVDQQKLGEFPEDAPYPTQEYDLIVHLLGLGHVNDLPGALIHARMALAEGGLFIAAFPGAGSLPILRKLVQIADSERPAARMHPLIDNRAGTALLERAGFARQVVDSFPISVRYSSLETMIEDLRDHGLTSSIASPAPPLTRSVWARAKTAFDELADDEGKVTETFEMLTLTGWR